MFLRKKPCQLYPSYSACNCDCQENWRPNTKLKSNYFCKARAHFLTLSIPAGMIGLTEGLPCMMVPRRKDVV